MTIEATREATQDRLEKIVGKEGDATATTGGYNIMDVEGRRRVVSADGGTRQKQGRFD